MASASCQAMRCSWLTGWVRAFTAKVKVSVPFATCGLIGETKHAYIDFLIPRPWGYICLEVDEGEHAAYDPSCDPRRDFDIFSSIALGSGGKVLILRFNPDGF